MSTSAALRVPFLDLPAQWEAIGAEIMDAIAPVGANARFVMGPAVEQFEREVEAYIGCRHAIGCASGTDALLLGMMALGVGPGDEVIAPSFTFYATASPASRLGATPVFADVDAATFNVTAAEIERCITPRTKLVVPVHQYGQPVEQDAILELCRARGIAVLEDAAQAIGSTYNGRNVGVTGGAAACFSFFPSKNLGCLGDGGMIVTDDNALADEFRALRNHGGRQRYYHESIGLNSRLDSIQAAALSVKLRYLDAWNAQRGVNAAYYNERFAGADGILAPTVRAACTVNWNLYTVRVTNGRRDTVRDRMGQRGIGVETYWPLPLHLQQCFAPLGGRRGDLPVSERLCDEVLSLPVYPELTEQQREYVADTLIELAR